MKRTQQHKNNSNTRNSNAKFFLETPYNAFFTYFHLNYRMLDSVVFNQLDSVVLSMLDSVVLSMLDSVVFSVLDSVVFNVLDSVVFNMLDSVVFNVLDSVVFKVLDSVVFSVLDCQSRCWGFKSPTKQKLVRDCCSTCTPFQLSYNKCTDHTQG